MALKISTGLRDHMLVTGHLKNGIDGGVIRIYDGTVPATADAALSGNNLLCVISNNMAGTGINMGTTPASGVLGKAAAETWKGLIAITGTASFYRYSGLTDAGASSTTEKRLQGTVAAAGGDLNFSSVAFVANASNTKSVDTFNVVLPTS
jgi:hypothetical protein